MDKPNHQKNEKTLENLIDGLIDELHRNPKDERIWLTCGTLYFLKNDFENSLDCFLMAHSLDPSDANVILRIGMIFYKLKKWEKARNWLNMYLDIVMPLQTDWTVYYFLALIYDKLKQRKIAIRTLEEGLKKFPRNVLLLLTYAEFQFENQEFQKASETFERLLQIETKQEYWYFLFRCYHELGYEDLASHSFRQFMNIDPNFRLNEDWISLLGLTVHAENYSELKKRIEKMESELFVNRDFNQLENLKSLYQGDSTADYVLKITEIQKFLRKSKDHTIP